MVKNSTRGSPDNNISHTILSLLTFPKSQYTDSDLLNYHNYTKGTDYEDIEIAKLL